MSIAFREKYGKTKVTDAIRKEWAKRPGTMDENGKPVYVTEQHHKEQTDINAIIAKYDRDGLISHVSKFEADFGDMTQVDFKDSMDLITKAQQQFDALPSDIRTRFENDPGKLIGFMEDGANRQEAIELGLINADWTEATDGLGEHVDGKVVQHEMKPETQDTP